MRLFYGGRAFKDPPLTTIFLLVFVFVCHGVSGDETTTTDSTTQEATTTRAEIDCTSIAKTFSIDEIVKQCEEDEYVALAEGQWFFLSSISKENVEKFLKEKKTMIPGIHIENRPDIDILDLNDLSLSGVVGKGGLHIVNTSIHTIKYINTTQPKPKILRIHGTITIRGNKHLKQTTIDNLNLLTAGKGADIQSFGECFVPLLITDLKELDDCHYVTGDLTFANWPSGTTSNEIKWITGSVKIINTDLTRLPFSQKEKIKIDGNLEFQDNAGLCWINDENYKDYFEVKGKVRIRNTPCPYTPSVPINTTTRKKKKSKKTTTTVAPAVTEEATTKESNTVPSVVPILSALFIILL